MRLHYFAVIALLAFACKAPREKKTDVVALTWQVAGVYEASLPCQDCISIEYQLELEPDSSFIEHITFLGKPDGNYEVHGTWVAGADSLLTLSPGRLAYKIKVNANGSLTISDATENHLEKQPAVLMRLAAQKADESVLLNDIWVLEAIDQTEITEADYAQERPQLEFHKVDGKIIGTTGCNRLSGTYTTTGNNISFGPMLTTKMACPGNGETRFVNALGEVTSFKIVKLKLYLLAGSTEKLRFREAD
ncbi:MAG: META domain-containing protein [Cyclobacteriaceae bacterium]|nr:META domain-containing protein [Cyclobacteriaceae bacterium]